MNAYYNVVPSPRFSYDNWHMWANLLATCCITSPQATPRTCSHTGYMSYGGHWSWHRVPGTHLQVEESTETGHSTGYQCHLLQGRARFSVALIHLPHLL